MYAVDVFRTPKQSWPGYGICFGHGLDTVIADVASTGNSGSGVFDTAKQCLLGIMSGKIQLRFVTVRNGAPVEKLIDVAKYFVPAAQIRQFILINR
jgi:hypothetical protein